MIFNFQNYRDFMRASLLDKATRAKGVSLRSFAEKLRVSNSYLSEVIAGKKALSMDLAFKTAVRLGLSDKEIQYFCLLVQIEHEEDPEYRDVLRERLQVINPEGGPFDLSLDLFKTISDWHHFAILELTHLTNFTVTPKSVTRKLGIEPEVAKEAIERLLRLELLELDKGTGKLRKSHGYVLAESATPLTALRNFHRQMLQKASESLEAQTPQERISSSDIFPIDSKFIPQIDRLALEFTKSVLQLADKSKVHDTIYACLVQSFRVSKKD